MVWIVKAQFEVREVLWRKIRVASLEAGKSIGELLEPVLEREFNGKRVMSGSARMNSEVAGKSERDKQTEEIPPVKVNPPISEKPKWVPPVIDQSTCKHPKFMPNPEGLGTKCVRCGFVPPL